MENEQETAPRQFTRPQPTGNLFFYRPQNEAGTPLKQSQIASEPLSTPDSPSMVCSGGSGVEEEEEDGGSCHNKEETIANSKAPLEQQHQQKVKEAFNNAFPYPVFPTQNNRIKKDTGALDLILQKAAAFLSPLPQVKEKVEEEDAVVVAEEQEEMTPRGTSIVPRCLTFDEEESIHNNLKQHEGQQQKQYEHCGDIVVLIPPPALESTQPVVLPDAGNALHRLKVKTLERQSSQVAALSKLKQLTVRKQQHRIAAMRPQSTLVGIHGGDNRSTHTTSIGFESNNITYNDNACSKSNLVYLAANNTCLRTALLPPAAAHPQQGGTVHHPHNVSLSPSSTNTICIRTRTEASVPATEDSLSTGKKPYLKRRSTAIPMQHQGVPDWSAVKSRTQSRLDSNSILRTKNSGGNSNGASVAARQWQHAPSMRRCIDDNREVGIETMEQYRANYHNNQQIDKHGVRNRGSVPPLSTALKRNPWGSNRPSTAPRSSSATPSAGPLSQCGPLSAAHRAAIRSRPFSATSIAANPDVPPASRTAFGPLGAAVIASGVGSNRQQHRHQDYSDSEIGHYEDPLLPLVSQVDQLLNSVGRAIRR